MSEAGESVAGHEDGWARVVRLSNGERRREERGPRFDVAEGELPGRELVSPRGFVDELRDAYVVTDESGRVVYTNPAARELLAQGPQGLRGSLIDVLGASGATVVAKGLESPGLGVRSLDSIVVGTTTFAVRVSHDVQDGLVHWLLRPEAAPTVVDPEARFREALVARMPGVGYVCAIDEIWSCLYVTPQVAQLLGYRARDWCDDRELWLDCIHADDRERVVTERMRAVTFGTTFSSEYRLQHADGHYLYVQDEAVCTPVEGELRVAGVLIDATARRHSHEVVSRRRDSLRREVQHLRFSEEARDGFIQLFVHDVRSALTGAVGLTQTLRSGRVEDEELATELLDRVLANLTQVRHLTEEVLDFSRLQRDGVAVRPVELDVCDLVRSSLQEAGLIDRLTYLQSGPVRAVVDPMITKRVVTNLVANAARHCAPEVPIRVRLLEGDEGLLIVVEDEGDGVPDEFKERVFEPFVRLGSLERSGLGLGLALVRRLAGWHGGRVWIEDTPGGGAAFHVLLPPDSPGLTAA